MKPSMRLLLTFRDKSRPHSPSLAEAEIRVNDFHYYQEQLTAVPMNNSCSRLEFSLPLTPRTLRSDLATAGREWSHFESTLHRHALSLRISGTRQDATLAHYLTYMVSNLSEEFQSRHDNIVVTLKTHPLNGTFQDSVILGKNGWAHFRPLPKPDDLLSTIPVHALTA